MRFALLAVPVGAIRFLMGVVSMLQGVGALPGRVMTGSQFLGNCGLTNHDRRPSGSLVDFEEENRESQRMREDEPHF